MVPRIKRVEELNRSGNKASEGKKRKPLHWDESTKGRELTHGTCFTF